MRLPPTPLVWIYTAAGVVLVAATLTCGGGESLTAPTGGTLGLVQNRAGHALFYALGAASMLAKSTARGS